MARPSRKGEVLEAAIDLFSRQGYHATSIRDIVETVGMSKAGLYSSFSSKEQLLEEIYYTIIDEMLDRLQEIAATHRTPAEKLRDAIIWQVAGTVERIPEMTIFYRERHHLSDETAARIAGKRRAYESILETIIADGVAAGQFRAVDVKVTAFGIAGMCAWTYRWYREGGRLSAHEIGELYADLALHGLSDERLIRDNRR
jgi:TetR/AcrR family transcriptional regulator, cholesterol catabolism regulator